MNATRPAAEWVERRERGSPGLIHFMVRLSLLLGRGPSRVLLRGIAAYFFVTGGAARRACAAFLARVHGRPATWREQYRTFFAFAATIHDRIYFLKDRFGLFDIARHGVESLGPGGAVLMGAHFGSFDALRACGRHLGGFEIAMAMYQANAQKVIAALATVAPDAARDIVPLGRVESMLELSKRLDAGAVVGVLADRTFGPEPTIDVDFLGAPAAFPTGPMRMAAAMRRQVFFMAGIYRGAHRYEMRIEPLADFRDLEGLTRAQRDARVQAAIQAYARRLEHFARSAPDNWFNFFDFWARR